MEDKPRTGHPRKLCREQLTRLKRLVNHKTRVSLRRVASKFQVTHPTIRTYLQEMGIKYYKRQRSPKYTDKQLQEVPTLARRLYRMLSNDDFQLVMDDEKYFCLSDQSVSTNREYYSSDKGKTKPEVKFKRTRKYEEKVLVWIAISTNGISSPFFAKQQQAINETTYLNECIIHRLIPFINNHHSKDKVLFWPYLASSHYSSNVTRYLDQNGIQFVSRHFNLQNCPQSRPIETLWSILKDMVYDEGWKARNIDELKRRIIKKMKEIDIKVVQTMFSGIRKQLRKVADHEAYNACSS